MLLVVLGSLGIPIRILVPMNQAMFWIQSLSVTAIAGILAGAGVAATVRKAPMLTVLSTTASVLALALMYSVVLPHHAGLLGTYLPLYFTVQATVAAGALSAGGLRALTERQRKSAIEFVL
jgi:hypothetical protein